MVKSLTAQTFVKSALVGFGVAVTISHTAVAQSSDSEAAYSSVLQQIADVKTGIAYKRALIEKQKGDIASLRKQLGGVGATGNAVEPMLEKIRAAVTAEVEQDLPFNLVERNDRLAGFDDIMADKEAKVSDKWRRALNLLSAEVAYGQTVESYPGDHPVPDKAKSRLTACEADAMSSACALSEDQKDRINAGETIGDLVLENQGLSLADGHYLRYGRLALAYVQADGSDVYSYDPVGKSWAERSGAQATEIRRSMKMAKGEAAPNVITVPVWISE